MTSRNPRPVNVALRRTRRWTAGVLLTSTLAAGGLGLHLADAYAASKTDAAVAAGAAATTSTSSATGSSSTPTTSPATTNSTAPANPQQYNLFDDHRVDLERFVRVVPDEVTWRRLVELRRHEHEGLVMTVYRHDFLGDWLPAHHPDAGSGGPRAWWRAGREHHRAARSGRFPVPARLGGQSYRRAGFSVDVRVVVSPLLGRCVEAALHAAEITDGLVDPTVGRAVAACGYDADIEVVRGRPAVPGARESASGTVIPGWRTLHYDARRRLLTVPRGCLLDLGATAKAFAADLIAARLAEQLPGGFLVNLGGDIAVSGELPGEGWEIGVEDHHGVTRQVVVSRGQAVATSSTQVRRWTHGTEQRHHIVDPRTGRTAATVWAQVSCAGVSAVEANAASTAAVILGTDAPAWLEGRGIPARLDGVTGSVVVTPGWPAAARPAA